MFGRLPRRMALQFLLLVCSDSQFAAVGISGRAHQLVMGLAAVECPLEIALELA